jgi:hypothetical protein
MNQRSTQIKVFSVFQWLFRVVVILSAIATIVVNTGTPYTYLPKQLYYGAGIWFFWYSVPVLSAVFVALSIYWQIIKKHNPVKSLFPKIDLWFLLTYIVLWFVFRFLILKIGF